ncbi:DNA-binding FadR family transcriptional regulator [Palleronia aestuarii]|uniref:DNA-binding FadR family transcriptional regulator n=1 Tax=Palleronia aestuarii TaxID=568105 RepID=A0A2W7MZK7_9RHOB|nr:FadR/GntR family transcriptional regulator [Palleronia aestuarii]PZX13013.1 DNA-binding FadR family transcriptional regulator [Palleronia aestuarii]
MKQVRRPGENSAPLHTGSQSRAERVAEGLRRSIRAGEYKTGGKLPAEVRLVDQFGVSRTVIREALAVLRADGLLVSRRGSGAFVCEAKARALDFTTVDPQNISSILEMLELRMAVEVETAAFAALRRTAAQEVAMMEANETLRAVIARGEPSNDADYGFHHAVALGSGNPRFAAFLEAMGVEGLPRKAVRGPGSELLPDLQTLLAEHDAIIAAIMNGDPDGARQAMRTHLLWSQKRYRTLMLSHAGAPAPSAEASADEDRSRATPGR